MRLGLYGGKTVSTIVFFSLLMGTFQIQIAPAKAATVTLTNGGNRSVMAGTSVTNSINAAISGVTATTYIQDAFTGSNNSNLNAHAPNIGGSWVDEQSTNGIKIFNNRVRTTQTFGDSRVSNNTIPATANYEVSIDVVWNGNSSSSKIGIQGRSVGPQNRADGYYAIYNAVNNRWELGKYQGFNQVTLGTFTQTYVSGQTHNMKLGMNGSTITLYVDGVSRISVTDASFSSAGKTGIFFNVSGTDTNSLFGDNYMVTGIGGGTSTVNFSTSGLPTGVTASFSPTSCTLDCSTTLSLNAQANSIPGTYPITVTGTAGVDSGSTTFNLTITADTPPTVTFVSPGDGATVPGSIVLMVNATDNVGVTGVQYIVDGVNLGSPVTSPYQQTWDTTNLPNGPHTVTARATDTAGNQSTATITVNSYNVQISNVRATNVTGNSAQILWDTNVVSDSRVDFGLTTAYNFVGVSTVNSTSHAVLLTGLTGSTLYHYRVVSRDSVGNQGVSGDFTFTTSDSTAPAVSITSPTSDASIIGSTIVNATASDNVSVVGVQFKLDGNDLGLEDTTSPYGVSWDSTSVANGVHTLSAIARDAAGNSTTSQEVNVNVNNPVADTQAPLAPQNFMVFVISDDRIDLAWDVPFDNVGVTGYKLYRNSVLINTFVATSTTTSYSDLNLDPTTTYSYAVSAFDAAGNEGPQALRSGTTLNDTTPPTVSITSPVNGSTVTGSTNITSSVSDNVGITGVQFKLNGNNFGAEDTTAPYSIIWDTASSGPGTYTITATARDTAGNLGNSFAPAVTVTVASGPYSLNNGGQRSLVQGSSATNIISAVANQPSGPVSTTYMRDNFTGTNGTNLVTHTPDLGGGWLEEQGTNVLRILNNQLQTVQGFGDSRVSNATVPPTANYAVSMDVIWNGPSSANKVEIQGRAAGPQNRADGYYALYNAASNRWELGKYVGFNPTTLGTFTQTYVQGQTHNMKLVMNGSAISLAVDGVTRVSVTDTSFASIGKTGIRFNVSGVDYTSMFADNYQVTDLGSSAPTMNFTVSGLPNNSTASFSPTSCVPDCNTTITINTSTSTTPGTYPVTVTGTVGTDSTNTTFNLIVNALPPDTTAPTVSMINPTNGSTVGGNIIVSANAADNINVAGVQFTLDGANLGSEDTTSPYTASWNTTTLANGSAHTLTAVARDAAGNSTTSTSFTVTVDNTIPAGPVLYSADRTQSPITPALIQRWQSIASAGVGLRPQVYMKVGDSNSTDFMRCFDGHIESGNPTFERPWIIKLGGRDYLVPTIQYFRSVTADGTDSPNLRQSAAVVVGSGSPSPLLGSNPTLIQEYNATLPQYAIIMFGSNDIQGTLPTNLANYEAGLRGIVDALIQRGVIPILTTMPERQDNSAYPLLVPAFNGVVRAIAQGRQIPMIDANRDLWPATNHGISSDGVHFSMKGSFENCQFVTSDGDLNYGMNVRNLASIEALHRIKSVLTDGSAAPDANAALLSGAGSVAAPFEAQSLPFVDMRDNRVSTNSNFTNYSCAGAPSAPGNEYLYRLNISQTTSLKAIVLDAGANAVNINLLSAANSNNCIQSASRIIETTLNPGTYYIAVDGLSAGGGAEYTLSITANR